MRRNDQAIITDVQKFSVHDGPGIRTVVFFKGCPLRCIWCQNPETQNCKKQIMWNPDLCIGCGICASVCPTGAVLPSGKQDRNKCINCGVCVENCYAQARKLAGKIYTLDELFEIILADEIFYRNSNGGVTASGGEATMQADFLINLFKKCKEKNISTALETCGYCDTKIILEIAEWCDIFLYDIKLMDPKRHEYFTGKSNEIILENLKKLSEKKAHIVIRVPFIPGVNDDKDNLHLVGELAKRYKIKEVHLLPFHQFGESKWNELGEEYKCGQYRLPEEDELISAAELIENYGLNVNIGGYGRC